MRLLLAGLISLFLGVSALAEGTCEYPEQLIIDALAQEPNRLIIKLEGKELEAFLSKMTASGYLSGSLPQVTSLYIIRGKLLPTYHESIDILFFINSDGCIVGKIYGTAAIIENMLPCGRYCAGSRE